MSSRDTGSKAELAAKVYLEMRGFKIIELNWRRPRVEIDIIAQKDGVIHFVEVKYRYNDEQGGGLEAITAAKLQQMRRGAEMWTTETKWSNEYVISGIEVAGSEFAIMNFVEDIL